MTEYKVTTSLSEQIYTLGQYEKAKKFKPIKTIEIIGELEEQTFKPVNEYGKWHVVTKHFDGEKGEMDLSESMVDRRVEYVLENKSGKIFVNYELKKIMKGFKTATDGKKSHRDNITQLENSVRKMF